MMSSRARRTCRATGARADDRLALPFWRRLPLRRLLLAFFGTLLSGVLLALGFVVYWQVSGYLWHRDEQAMEQRIGDALHLPLLPPHMQAARAVMRMPPGGVDELRSALAAIASPIFLARLLTPEGGVELEVGGPPEAPPIDRRWVEDTVERLSHEPRPPRGGSATMLARAPRERWELILVPLVDAQGRVAALIEVGMGRHESDHLLAALARYLVGGLLGAWGLCLLGCTWLARRLGDPVERLVETMDRVSDGDLETRANLGDGENELIKLGQGFDAMVARLQDSFAAQQRFVADASHELQTPLTNIGGMTDVLRLALDRDDPARRQKALDTIARETARMSRLVADLLLLSRAQEAPLQMTPVAVRPLLDEIRAAVSPRLAGQVLEVTADPDLIIVGDETHVRRAVENLVENAVRYTPAEKRITLSAGADAGGIRIEVRDEGSGIAPADLPHVFDRFYRMDPSRSRRTGGTGLGLPIVKSIVERHGGTVEIESQPDIGTTVRLRFPGAVPRSAG